MSESLHKLTIETKPVSANVVLTATGYTQSGNSISVPEGTTVTYSVRKKGYEDYTNTYVMTDIDKTITISLVKMYTITIKPSPSTALVELFADGYTQYGNSISVPYGTKVSYSVSQSNYYKKTGDIEVDSTKSIKIPLIEKYDGIDIYKETIEKKRDLNNFYPKEFSNRRLINQFNTYITNNIFEKDREKYVNGYIGERASGDSTNDYYISEPTKNRQLQQLLPIVKTNNEETTFINYINSLKTEGSYIYNQNKLLSEKYWSWTPPIDVDMFLNYSYYYWLGNNEDNMPIIKIMTETNYLRDIEGNKDYTIVGTITFICGDKEQTEENVELKLENGMRIMLMSDLNTEYNNIPYMVSGCGESIKFLDETNIINQLSKNFDKPDYFVMERGCIDGNQWSEHNRWVHKSVLEKVDANLIKQLHQAKYPIMCFNKDIELYDYGTFSRGYVDLATEKSSKDINGKVLTTIDDVPVSLIKTILCYGDSDNNQHIFRLTVAEDTGLILLIPLMNGRQIENDTSVSVKGDVVNYLNKKVSSNKEPNKYDFGGTMYYDGEKWVEAQEKELNKEPLFMLYDSDKVELNNKARYLNSTFTGSTLYQYKQKITDENNEEYKTINDLNKRIVVDKDNNDNYIFTNTIETDTFKYTPSIGEEFEEIKGYKFFKLNNSNTYLNDWYYTSFEGTQLIKTQFVVSDKNLLEIDGSIKIILDLVPDELEGKKTLYVRQNGELLNNLTGDYTIEDNIIIVKQSKLGDVFDIKFYKKNISKQLPDGYIFEEPLSIQVNPTNEDIKEIKYNNCFDQMVSIIENQEDFIGSGFGMNNYYTIGKDLSVGNKIVQHSEPIIRSMILSNNDYTSSRNAIEFVSNEYLRFRNKFTTILNDYFNSSEEGFTDDEETYEYYFNNREKLSDFDIKIAEIINRINVGKEGLKPFYNNGVLVNIVKNAYVPATASYLGASECYKPEITKFEETLQDEKPSVILSHDGSYVSCYGDLRDLYVLRLEELIYESINDEFKSEDYRPLFNKYEILPGYFRTSGYNRTEYNRVYSPFFEKWCSNNNIDYYTNSLYDANDWRTWNWSSVSIKETGENLFGSYKAIYNYFYDTYRPNTCPWEMLGFNTKPSWWEEEYGSAPYTSNNIAMWEDIENGYIRNGEYKGYHKEFERKGLVEKYLPVDDEGNLLNPVDAGIASTSPLMSNAKKDWVVGDLGEVEFAYQQTYSYRFDLQNVLYLLKPVAWVELNWNTLNTKLLFNGTKYQQIVDKETGKRESLKDVYVHNELVDNNYIRQIGIQQWISDYMVNDNLNITDKLGNELRSCEVVLGYRCAGFYQEGTISILSDTAGVIPEENYELKLFKSKNGNVLTYSGIIIQKTKKGFKIDGFDRAYPYFMARIPYETGKHVSFTINGKTIKHYKEWKNSIKRVPYNTTFTQIQDVYDFIIGYGKYLTENEGWYFNNRTSSGEILDFTKSGESFVLWATSVIQNSDSENTAMVLNPGVLGLGLYHNGVVENIEQRINGFWAILDIYNKPIKNEDISVFRQSFNTYFTPNDRNISLLKVKTYEYEHLLTFDNETIFGDVLFNPTYSSVVNRLKLTGVKAKNWYGNTYAPGFILQDNGAIPNYEKNASDIPYIFDTDSVKSQGALSEYAKATIGYVETSTYKNLLLNKQTMFDFYKGSIQEQGTIKPIKKLNRSNYIASTDNKDVELYENWAFKMGEFGHISDNAKLEFLLNKEIMNQDPQIITFESLNNYYWDENISYMKGDFVIYNNKEYQAKINNTTTGKFEVSEWKFIRNVNNYIVYWDDNNWIKKPDSKTFKSFSYTTERESYPTGGFGSLEDVDIIVEDEEDLEDKKDSISIGQVVWIVKTQSGDWDIRRKTGIEKFVSLRYDTIEEAYNQNDKDYVYKITDNGIDYFTNKNSKNIELDTKLYTDKDMDMYACKYSDLSVPYYTTNYDYSYVAGTNYKVKLNNTVFNSPLPENEVNRESTLLTLISASDKTVAYDFPYKMLLPTVSKVKQYEGDYYLLRLEFDIPSIIKNYKITITRKPASINEYPEIKTYQNGIKTIYVACYKNDEISFNVSAENCSDIDSSEYFKTKYAGGIYPPYINPTNGNIIIKDETPNIKINPCFIEGSTIVQATNLLTPMNYRFDFKGKYTMDFVGAGGGSGGASWKKKKKKNFIAKAVLLISAAVLSVVTGGVAMAAFYTAWYIGASIGVSTAIASGVSANAGANLIHKKGIKWTYGGGAGSGSYVKAVYDINGSITREELKEKNFLIGAGTPGLNGNYGKGQGDNGSSGGTSYFKRVDGNDNIFNLILSQGGAGGWGSNQWNNKTVNDYESYDTNKVRKCGAGGIPTIIETDEFNASYLKMNESVKINGNSANISSGSYGGASVYPVESYHAGQGANPQIGYGGNGYGGYVKVVIDKVYDKPDDIVFDSTLIAKNKDTAYIAELKTYSAIYQKFFDVDEYVYTYGAVESQASSDDKIIDDTSKVYRNRSRKIIAKNGKNMLINIYNYLKVYNVGDKVSVRYDDCCIGTYIVEGSTTLSSDWLSLTETGEALTPEKDVIYKVLSEGNYQNKLYFWNGFSYEETSDGYEYYICSKSYSKAGEWDTVKDNFEQYTDTYYFKITENSTENSSELDSDDSSVYVPKAFSKDVVGSRLTNTMKSFYLYYDEECKTPVESTSSIDGMKHYTVGDLNTSNYYDMSSYITLCDEIMKFQVIKPVFLTEPVWSEINGYGTYKITSGLLDYYSINPKNEMEDSETEEIDKNVYSDIECKNIAYQTIIKRDEEASDEEAFIIEDDIPLTYDLISNVQTDRLEQTYEIQDGDNKIYTNLSEDKIQKDTPVYSDTNLTEEAGEYGDYIPTWEKITYTPKKYVNENIKYINYDEFAWYILDNNTEIQPFANTLYYNVNQGINGSNPEYKVYLPSSFNNVITSSDEKYGRIVHSGTDIGNLITLYNKVNDTFTEIGNQKLYVKLSEAPCEMYVREFDSDIIDTNAIISGTSTTTSLEYYYVPQCKGENVLVTDMLKTENKTEPLTINYSSSNDVETSNDVMMSGLRILKNSDIEQIDITDSRFNSLLLQEATQISLNDNKNGKFIDVEELMDRYVDYRKNNTQYTSYKNIHMCKIYDAYRCYSVDDEIYPRIEYVKLFQYGDKFYISKQIINEETYNLGIYVGDKTTLTTFTKISTDEITEDAIQNYIEYKKKDDILYIKNDSFVYRNSHKEKQGDGFVYVLNGNILEDTNGISTETDAYSGKNDKCWLKIKYQNKTFMFDLYEIQRKMVNVSNIKSAYLVDDDTNKTISKVQIFDPIQGYFPNNILSNIDYITATNPVLDYESNTSKWGDARVGFLWWDLSKVRYLDYHQGSLEYRRSNWGKQLLGSKIIINEWTKSIQKPEEDIKYITKEVYNPTTDSNDTYYYYWVENPTTIGNNRREISAFDIAQIINDPTRLDILWTSPVNALFDEFQENNLILANHSKIISGYNAVLQYNIDSDKEVIDHTEWALVKENSDEPVPERLWEKMKDSILGYKEVNGEKLPVPDTNLPERNQVGISFRPRQSMFKSLYNGRENFIDVINYIFGTRDIGEATDVSSDLVNYIDEPTNYDESAYTYSEMTSWTDTDLIGKRILVKKDEEHDNIWTIYKVNSLSDFELVDYQKYNISKYISYKNWYKDEDIASITPVATYPSLEMVDTEDLEEGSIVKIQTEDRWYLYQWDGKSIRNLVGVENILLELSDYLYDYVNDTNLSTSTDPYFIEIGELKLTEYDYINNEVLLILNRLFEYFES